MNEKKMPDAMLKSLPPDALGNVNGGAKDAGADSAAPEAYSLDDILKGSTPGCKNTRGTARER